MATALKDGAKGASGAWPHRARRALVTAQVALAVILVIGAELNAELEHQTARDTTTGMPLPMGARGAYVADTLGEAVN
jgi:negative regulator of sigma E activity